MWLLDKMLRKIVKNGELIVHEAGGKIHHYGAPDPARAPVTIRFTDAATPNRIARDPRLGAAEAWMDGRMTVDGDDILGLVDLFRSNAQWDMAADSGLEASAFKRLVHRATHGWDRLNWESRSKRNVAHHYDLDDRLYSLFLDVDRQYSCAYFRDEDVSLDQAQLDKKAHIAAKLALAPGQRVLDIGCGWGGMALYLHRVADVDVLGVTLSEEQLKVARARAEAAGVASRVKFELIDYRNVTGKFDRIVSVGMFEHVGPPHYETFFAKCRELLADEGVMLLHTIGRMGKPGTTDLFTSRYIFPGGYNPALSEVISASEKVKLIASDIEMLRVHYALTIRHWYDRTVAARKEIEALYDARFWRMWTFYLAGAMTAFSRGGLCNYQIQYIRRRNAVPLTRDYIGEAEAALRAKAPTP
ncbi:SAM-dependent methyltransferase [Sphingomonas quercus]|uniref:Cyclopropane-fatty-acyl-phospholipid synthase family protein n=1 Tax=Sphingomonas quercus TaxID=2842451 RepID=A0ABS6BLR6_9SPHN|nr:cyclopropane-fatty-acyl-phospholipid synthase family protein [Sphingomonas quercus]MBU3079260.1 cyclopropane-fatty-acyl-phospholipid synthase family protein [Sphingomonas quercus]